MPLYIPEKVFNFSDKDAGQKVKTISIENSLWQTLPRLNLQIYASY